MEFLVRIEVHIPSDLPPEKVSELMAAEFARGRELQAEGRILRIWRVPGRTANVGIWDAPDPTDLHEAIASLPLFPHLKAEVAPLAVHPLEG